MNHNNITKILKMKSLEVIFTTLNNWDCRMAAVTSIWNKRGSMERYDDAYSNSIS